MTCLDNRTPQNCGLLKVEEIKLRAAMDNERKQTSANANEREQAYKTIKQNFVIIGCHHFDDNIFHKIVKKSLG